MFDGQSQLTAVEDHHLQRPPHDAFHVRVGRAVEHAVACDLLDVEVPVDARRAASRDGPDQAAQSRRGRGVGAPVQDGLEVVREQVVVLLLNIQLYCYSVLPMNYHIQLDRRTHYNRQRSCVPYLLY